jgi:multiple sugar transport system substrate-binding protein
MSIPIARNSLTKWAVLVVAVMLIGAGCARDSGQSATGDLIWAIGAVDGDPARHIAVMWNEQYPAGPKVRVVDLPESADDQRQLMAIEQNAGLSTIDILTLDVVFTGEFAAKGWLADLADVAGEIKSLSSTVPLESGTWNGTLWAAPFTTNVSFLYYRTDLVPEDFAENPPKTWEDLVTIAEEVMSTPGNPDALGGFVGQGAQYEGFVVNYLEYFWGAGGHLFNAEGTGVLFEPGPAKRAVQFMTEAQESGFYADGFDTMREGDALERFRAGEAVFMRNWTFAYDELQKIGSPVAGKVGMIPLPTFTGEGTTPALGGNNLGVSASSENVTTAKEFVKFASTNRDVQGYLASKSRAPTMRCMYLGTYSGMCSGPGGVTGHPHPAGKDPVIALVGKVLPHARARPSTPEWSDISAEIQQELYPVYSAQGAPDDAVDAIRTYLKRVVSEE